MGYNKQPVAKNKDSFLMPRGDVVYSPHILKTNIYFEYIMKQTDIQCSSSSR